MEQIEEHVEYLRTKDWLKANQPQSEIYRDYMMLGYDKPTYTRKQAVKPPVPVQKLSRENGSMHSFRSVASGQKKEMITKGRKLLFKIHSEVETDFYQTLCLTNARIAVFKENFVEKAALSERRLQQTQSVKITSEISQLFTAKLENPSPRV